MAIHKLQLTELSVHGGQRRNYYDIIITSWHMHPSLLSSSDPIKRDFTYISDVVGGIVAAMDHCPRRCGELYNLGNSEPISMETIMTYLETDLERKAIIVS